MKEITTLLADDDYLVLQDLQQLVDWKALGFCIIGTASNGKNALAIAQKEHPDLIITDISMPVMDGFDLIETLQKKYTDTYIIFISSYADFGYAKRAIKNGVRSYILKNEITAQSLTEQLKEVREFLQSQSHRQQRDIRSMLTGYFRENQADERLPEEYRHRRYLFFFLARQIPLERLNLHFQHLSHYGEELYQSVIPSLLGPFKDAIAFTMEENLIVGIPAKSMPDGYSRTAVSQTLSFLKKQTEALFPSAFTATHLSEKLTLRELRERYVHLERLLHFQNSFPAETQADLTPLLQKPFAPVRQSFPYRLLTESVSKPEGFRNALETHIRLLFEARDADNLFMLYHNLMLQMDELSGHLLPLPASSLFEGQEELVSFLRDTYASLCEVLTRSAKTSCSVPVGNAIEYMKQHFSDSSLTVEQIASAAFLSSSRLSVLFRQEMNQTVNDYLTELRISHAVYLLQNSNYKIYEIAEKAGYKSSQYFSQVFFQKTGQKPLYFRQNKPSS